MNDSELDQILKAAKVPARAEEYWTRFPQRVEWRLHWEPAPWAGPPSFRFQRLAWAGAVAAVCLLAGFAVGHWRGRTDSAANAWLQNRKVIQETLALFPNRVRAIVQDEAGVRLVLSEKDDVPASPPLWVKICDGRNCSVLVTFSGQEVQLAGQRVTVLSDARGGVLLMGRDFVWSNKQGTDFEKNLKIEARNLGPLAM